MNKKQLIFMGMGFELVGIISACLYLGNLIDEQYHLSGIGLAGVTMLGLTGWIIHIVKMTKQLDSVEDQKNQE